MIYQLMCLHCAFKINDKTYFFLYLTTSLFKLQKVENCICAIFQSAFKMFIK